MNWDDLFRGLKQPLDTGHVTRTDDCEDTRMSLFQYREVVREVGIPFVDEGLGTVWRELTELLHCHSDYILLFQLLDVDLLGIDSSQREDKGIQEFRLLDEREQVPEPAQRDPDISVDEGDGGSSSPLPPRLAAFISAPGSTPMCRRADPPLQVCQDPLNQDLGEVLRLEDFRDRRLLCLLLQCSIIGT